MSRGGGEGVPRRPQGDGCELQGSGTTTFRESSLTHFAAESVLTRGCFESSVRNSIRPSSSPHSRHSEGSRVVDGSTFLDSSSWLSKGTQTLQSISTRRSNSKPIFLHSLSLIPRILHLLLPASIPIRPLSSSSVVPLGRIKRRNDKSSTRRRYSFRSSTNGWIWSSRKTHPLVLF